MAVAVQSVSSTGFATGSATLTLTKPTGTVDGDLLIAVVIVTITGNSTVSAVPSGWTLVRSSAYKPATAEAKVDTYYKIASSEGASWDWTINTSTGSNGGGVLRITGASFVEQSSSATVANSATPSFANGLTPTIANSLLIIAGAATDVVTNPTTVSSYAIETNNPTWTEAFDLHDSSKDNSGVCAYAIRPETTATGNSTYTYSGGSVQDSVAQLLIISPETNITVNATPIIVTATIPNATVAADANVSATPLIATSTLPDETVTTEASKVTNLAKSSPSSVTNLSKS